MCYSPDENAPFCGQVGSSAGTRYQGIDIKTAREMAVVADLSAQDSGMNIVLSLHAVYSLPRDKHTLVWILASSPPQREATAGGGSPVLTCIVGYHYPFSQATSFGINVRMDNPTLPGLRSECGVGTITDTRELTLLSLQPMALSTRKCSKFLILRCPAKLQGWNDMFDYEAVRGSGFACQGMENECAGFSYKVSTFESARTRLTHHAQSKTIVAASYRPTTYRTPVPPHTHPLPPIAPTMPTHHIVHTPFLSSATMGVVLRTDLNDCGKEQNKRKCVMCSNLELMGGEVRTYLQRRFDELDAVGSIWAMVPSEDGSAAGKGNMSGKDHDGKRESVFGLCRRRWPHLIAYEHT
ncbi:hypothetical protein EV421DRAFT_1743256 [Armillaria borealis]|uniref:Uncharacterized protein n=2 Tax=Armillaria borealis TaxID=47425 RepID=A0AA39MEY4_9AGAR|nr:hypothetical protein EV421DRAFT_1743256 [Armillaria borealis]